MIKIIINHWKGAKIAFSTLQKGKQTTILMMSQGNGVLANSEGSPGSLKNDSLL